MTAQRNTMWIARVRGLLGQGYGVEDIALATQTPVEAVRDEITILRQSGELEVLYQRSRALWRRQSSRKLKMISEGANALR